ncbi:MAG: hypothetical protein IJY08_06655 [Clostridia bacterium]|nr:hypothetical protein [Clostridia bacterium]
MIKKLMSGGFAQRIAAVIIGIAILVYTVYHISSLFGEDIATIATGVSTEVGIIDSKGYIFRDETVLYSSNSGVAEYLKADGEKVSVSDELAVVHESGSDVAKTMLRVLDRNIALLERSVESGKTLSDLPDINDDISDAYYQLVKLLAGGDTGSISEQTDKLLLSMNCHSLLTDENSPVDDSLENMRHQRNTILKNGGESKTESAPDSGYFYSYVDGYEEYFTVDAAQGLTAERYYELVSGGVKADTNAMSNAYGKLADSFEWRFVMRVSELREGHFKVGETYNIEFVENGNTVVPMTLSSEVEDTVEGGKIFVFSANRLPDGFVFGRSQSVSIEVSSISGLYVPKSAVHRAGGTYYVFILRGSVVCYRRIDVIYEGSDYYLSATEHEDDGGAEYLGTNELLIIKGSNLFDGRILD